MHATGLATMQSLKFLSNHFVFTLSINKQGYTFLPLLFLSREYYSLSYARIYVHRYYIIVSKLQAALEAGLSRVFKFQKSAYFVELHH